MDPSYFNSYTTIRVLVRVIVPFLDVGIVPGDELLGE